MKLAFSFFVSQLLASHDLKF